MKHTYYVILTMLLVVALAVPAFASEYNGVELPDIYSIGKPTDYCYYILPNGKLNGEQQYRLIITAEPVTSNTEGTVFKFKANQKFFEYEWSPGDTAWTYDTSHTFSYEYTTVVSPVWLNFDVYDESGNLVYDGEEYVPPACDGSACPATDADHNNICDDCGAVLAYNLRSTEYDYAVILAEGRQEYGYPFYAIFQEGERYVIHVSKNPMTSPDGITLEAEGMMYTKTTANSNGSYSLTGWYNGYYAHTDSFVFGNHTIVNFPLVPPFLETMGEPIQEMGQEVVRTLATLTVCGIGCLALLIVLALFSKRSLIFRG